MNYLVPERYYDDQFQQFVFTVMQWLNIVVPAVVVHLSSATGNG